MINVSDDINVLIHIESINNCQLFQSYSYRLMPKAEILGLSFNISKYHSMNFTYSKMCTV